MTMSQKDTRRVVRGLEKQGARIKRTKDGHRILFPDGTTEMVHWSTSDYRATANLRSAVRRAGFHWPLDGEGKGTVMALSSKTEIDPRKVITQNKIRRILSKLSAEGFTTSEAVKISGVSFSGVGNNLPELGYVQTFNPDTKQKLWTKPDKKSTKSKPVESAGIEEQYPEIDAALATARSAMSAANEGLTIMVNGQEFVEVDEPKEPVEHDKDALFSEQAFAGEVGNSETEDERRLAEAKTPPDGWENLVVTVGDGAGPEVAGEHKLAELAQIPEFVEAVVAIAPAAVNIGSARTSGGREFIDSEDSWTLDGMLSDQVLHMAKMMGLEIEVRVWRSPSARD